jgi:hypothetical protein
MKRRWPRTVIEIRASDLADATRPLRRPEPVSAQACEGIKIKKLPPREVAGRTVG